MADMNYIIMGAGAWGTAIAIHLSKCGHRVVLVPRNEEKAKTIQEHRENIFHLPKIKLPDTLIVDSHWEAQMDTAAIVFMACPTQGLMDCCKKLEPFGSKIQHVVSLVKGLDRTSLKTPSELFRELLPQVPFACLSGPTYALEFAQGKHAAMVLASESDVTPLQKDISNALVRVYTSKDLKGVELGGCLKNIYAIGSGILEGLHLGDNARAAYLTRALKELAVLGTYLGGHKETFFGLSGLGDLIATAQGVWSRNRTFGYAFANGQTIESLLKEKTVEGYWSVQCFYKLCSEVLDKAPILAALHEILYRSAPLKDTINALMLRSLKQEF